MRVGLRSAYICTVLATKLMVTQRSGLIVNISSVGGMRYAATPLYGVRLAGMDRLVQAEWSTLIGPDPSRICALIG